MTTLLEPANVAELLGAQRPRLCLLPEGVVSSAGVEAIEVARVAGLDLDPWEEFVLREALGERADRKWAAFEVGTIVPRQNGKGTILEARELAGLFSFGEQLLIHSAHEQDTASEHFRRLLNLIEGVPEFDSRVLKAPKGKGVEAIELRGGQRIRFKTRTGGGGRGLTGDFVALDEAMILPVATTSALVPTMAARSVQGNPQLWYAGSAVDQTVTDHGVVLSRLRARALAKAPRLAYFDWSADGVDPDKVPPEVLADPEVWAQANPGLGIRISLEHIANEHAGALGPREFAVERLGIGDWPSTDPNAGGGFDSERWQTLADADSRIAGRVAFAFDVRPDRTMASISAAGRTTDDNVHTEVIDRRPGTGWIIDRLPELVDNHDPISVMCDQGSPAASLVPALANAGVRVEQLNTAEYGQACGTIFDTVEDGTLRHLDTPELNAAVRGAARRPLGDAWAWSRKSSTVDISPLVACTLAVWKIVTAPAGYSKVEVW